MNCLVNTFFFFKENFVDKTRRAGWRGGPVAKNSFLLFCRGRLVTSTDLGGTQPPTQFESWRYGDFFWYVWALGIYIHTEKYSKLNLKISRDEFSNFIVFSLVWETVKWSLEHSSRMCQHWAAMLSIASLFKKWALINRSSPFSAINFYLHLLATSDI